MKNIEELENYVSRNYKKLCSADGEDCLKCSKKGICMKQSKDRYIEVINNMDISETRFPLLLKLVKKYNCILEKIPSIIFNKMYGCNQWPNFGCVFRTKELCDNIDKIREVYSLLDENSKETYINTLMTRISCDKKYAESVYNDEKQYFIDDYRGLDENEVYVDCGAYIGDTFDDYLKYNKAPNSCYFFEPDDSNLKKLQQLVKSKKIESTFKFINKGVHDEKGKLSFKSGLGGNSHVVKYENYDEKDFTINLTTIDDEIKEPITFLKMDIEGCEQQALRGAQNHIKNDTPKLAICIYHRVEDFWEIPLMIKNLNSKYNVFKVVHYSKFWDETVFYAYCK